MEIGDFETSVGANESVSLPDDMLIMSTPLPDPVSSGSGSGSAAVSALNPTPNPSEAPAGSLIASCVGPDDDLPLPASDAELQYLRASVRLLEAENASLGEECGLLMEMIVRKHYKTIAEIKFMCKHSAKAKNIVLKK